MARIVSPLVLLLCLMLLGCTENGGSPISFQTESGSLFVANMTTLSVINLETRRVSNDIFGLGNAPNDMVMAENLLIVVNSISNDLNFFRFNQNGSLVSDGVADVGLAQNNNPWAAAPDGKGHLLITNAMQNTVSVFSLQSRRIERTLPAGIAPEPILVVGDYAYVGNTSYDFGTYIFGTGSLWKYDLNSWDVVDSVSVGTNPQDIALDSLGRFQIVCTGNYANIAGEIYVVQLEPLSVLRVIEIGGTPNRVVLASDSCAYLSAGGWEMSGDAAGFVMKYRYDTGQILRGADNPILVQQGASDIAISHDGRIFVSCFSGNCVNELHGDAVSTTYVVGTGPGAILIKE
jgi:DNA-binding beta-propeller fold protein YncE